MKTLFLLFLAPYILCALPIILIGLPLALFLAPRIAETLEYFARKVDNDPDTSHG